MSAQNAALVQLVREGRIRCTRCKGIVAGCGPHMVEMRPHSAPVFGAVLCCGCHDAMIHMLQEWVFHAVPEVRGDLDGR